MQKSMSKSGIDTRSGFRKRSKRRLYGMGSRSVMRIAYATIDPRPSRAPGPPGCRFLRVADEVPDDEEVAGELHLRDDVELHLEALSVRVAVDGLAPASSSSKRFSSPSRATWRK
jgi:hypothetical protein